MFFFKSKIFIINLLIFTGTCLAIPEEFRAKGFVYLSEIDPRIISSLRYFTKENFLGTRINSYKKSVVILTKQAALALKNVQDEVEKDGYCLVVYDAYRPQEAVDHFVSWGEDIKNQIKKSQYYPRVNKPEAFNLGYISKKSSHSRGSTVDLTIIKKDKKVRNIKESDRKLLDNFTIKYLDDGTVDMGSSFDLFDEASHTENNLIEQDYKKLRLYLKTIMEKHGFKNLSCEWWHYTLKDEPFKSEQDSSYFNFPVE